MNFMTYLVAFVIFQAVYMALPVGGLALVYYALGGIENLGGWAEILGCIVGGATILLSGALAHRAAYASTVEFRGFRESFLVGFRELPPPMLLVSLFVRSGTRKLTRRGPRYISPREQIWWRL